MAAIETAASPEKADVEAAISAVDIGGLVIIPSGSATWTTILVWTKPCTIQGQGWGETGTIIRDGVATGSRGIMQISASGGSAYRLTSIEFQHTTGGGDDHNGKIRLFGTSSQVRIDNCKFDSLRDENIFVRGAVYGVIDNCTFLLNGGDHRAIMYFNGHGPSGEAYGDWSWENAVDWGGPGAIYVEDCTIEKADGSSVYGCTDSWEGGRIVMRHCNLKNTRVGNHGTESGQRYRSGRSMEFYENEIDNTTRGSTTGQYIDIRGGGLIAFNNGFVGDSSSPAIFLTNYRNSTVYGPFGLADGTYPWDQADLTDAGGDGVFDSGTIVTGASGTITVAGTPWSANWAGYTLRTTATFAVTDNGALNTIRVPGAAWSTTGSGEWANWFITKSTGSSPPLKGFILSNTADTLTLLTSFFPAINFTGYTGEIVLSRSGYISSNTTSQITCRNDINTQAPINFKSGLGYEIRKIDWAMDQPGRGISTAIVGTNAPCQAFSQELDPVYQWNTTLNGVLQNCSIGVSSIKNNRDYYNGIAAGSFDGTVGCGYGPIAQRPATCTAGVGYFATDVGPQGTLYKATATDTWTEFYQPYTYPHPLRSQVQTPLFTPVFGTYNNDLSVAITCNTEGATIRYTTDGSEPTDSHGTVYSTDVAISATTTLKAIAYDGVLENSFVRTGVYTMVVSTPVFDPPPDDYGEPQHIEITCGTTGATIYYTTDGTTPTSGSTQYTGLVTLSNTTILKAIAIKAGYTNSAVETGTYAITFTTGVHVAGTCNLGAVRLQAGTV